MRRVLLLAGLVLFVAGCASDLSRHPVRTMAYWKPALARPLAERVGAAPPELVEYLALDNAREGLPNRPRAPALADDFLRDVRAALAALPAAVIAPLEGRLAGIYFIEDLGGTGFFDEIDDAGRAVAGFTVLDPAVLQRTANAWATWKESTPFQPGSGATLRATIQDAKGDTRANAIQYILLHELGHMLSIGAGVHPSWRTAAKDVALERYPFARLSWRHSSDRARFVSAFDAAFPQRKDVVYYFGAKLPAAQMLATYDALERTDFVTLYGATNPFDDFAEAFASYVHVVLMGKPWEIRIEQDGRPVKTYRACWDEARCAAKRRILESLLK
jgi:hypothetical protein